LELGTSLGFGTFCLAKSSESARVYSLEACPAQIAAASTNLRAQGIKNVELIEGNFRETLPGLLDLLEKTDVVYFDGDHRKEAVLWQFGLCAEKAVHGSVFIVGDIRWSAGMTEAWKILCRDRAIALSVDLFDCGLLFFRRNMEKQHFILGFDR
jgi:predicted O-methyltransferase YrrM